MQCRLIAAVAIALAFPAVSAAGQDEHASCMGLGASFYGEFAPQQMGLVAQLVNGAAQDAGAAPGATYSLFAQEKEGGSIPAPCGTRLE
jgi:hypothetical protein